jgi:hypothetical protein
MRLKRQRESQSRANLPTDVVTASQLTSLTQSSRDLAREWSSALCVSMWRGNTSYTDTAVSCSARAFNSRELKHERSCPLIQNKLEKSNVHNASDSTRRGTPWAWARNGAWLCPSFCRWMVSVQGFHPFLFLYSSVYFMQLKIKLLFILLVYVLFIVYILLCTYYNVTHPLTEASTRNLPGGGDKRRPVCKADNLTAICEPTVLIMCDPQRLTTLWVSMACYRDNFI